VIRDFRPTDTPRIVGFLKTQFPAEEALVGTRPEEIFRVVKAIRRLDRRLILGLARLFRHPIFRFLVVDEGQGVVATTLVSFPGPSVHLSMVVVDPSVRRRGYAKALLGRARAIGASLGRRYMVLDVLADNTPARTLYEGRLGYRPLREATYMRLDRPATPAPERTPLPPGIRPYAKPDDRPLLAIVAQATPPMVAEVLPRKTTGLAGTAFDRAISGGQSAVWVADRGHGPEAGLRASTNPNMEAGHFSDPIVADGADAALMAELVQGAAAWCWARGAQRILCSVPRSNTRGRAVLEKEGFHDALSLWTLYRPIA
jgi:ribosomal protein S18 acetylase RimI-like enzyme